MVSSICKRGSLAAAIALVFSGGLTAQAEVDTEMFSDSGIQGPAYSEILDTHAELANQFPEWVKVVDYGTSVAGKTLRLVRIQSPDEALEAGNRPGVVISGSTHGNEYLNIEDRLAGWFLENRVNSPGLMRFLNAGGVIYVIPILNPDGYESRSRANANGVDLNRDFELVPAGEPNFREAETKALKQFFDREFTANHVDLRVSVDYHCCDGSMLFPWSYTMDNLPTDILAGHDEIARLMQEDIDPSYRVGSTGQVLGYNPRGTSKDFYFAKYGALAFTFEGSYGKEDENFPKHTIWWDHIFSTLID